MHCLRGRIHQARIDLVCARQDGMLGAEMPIVDSRLTAPETPKRTPVTIKGSTSPKTAAGERAPRCASLRYAGLLFALTGCVTIYCGGAVAHSSGTEGAAGGGRQNDGGAEAQRILFASDSAWPSYAGDLGGRSGPELGPAREVCVTASIPANCRQNALVYTSAGSGWSAAVPNSAAHWIWRGDVTVGDVADLKFAVFERTFALGPNPSGAIQVGADDFAEVLVNGSIVGAVWSVTDISLAVRSQSTLATFSLTPHLRPGNNTITVVGQNGPPSYASCAAACTYAQNPAGVVFAGFLAYP